MLRDVEESKQTFAIRPNPGDGSGIGRFSVAVDGANVWPPKGEGCEAFVGCCNHLVAAQEEIALACLLSIGRDKKCDVAKQTVSAIAAEKRVPVPAACGT